MGGLESSQTEVVEELGWVSAWGWEVAGEVSALG